MERPDHPDTPKITEFLNQFGEFSPGCPRYRFVWSSEQFENRLGTYCDYYGDVFLREVTEVRQVPKYMIFKDRWVLEKAEANLDTRELADKVVYAPFWVFHDRHGNYLPPSLKSIKFLMWFALNPGAPLTKNDLKREEQEEFEKEAEFFVEYMANEYPETAIALKEGSAVFISGESK